MEKSKTQPLTNEVLRAKFKSSFELVNYAIKLAENMIKTGRDTRVKSDVQNRAMLIIEEINEGKDKFDEIKTNEEGFEFDVNGNIPTVIREERIERRKFRTSDNLGHADSEG